MEMQFKELRSRVVKEACKTIEMLAETFFDSFAPVAVKLMPTLINLTMNKVAVLYEAADHCVRAVLQNSPSSSLAKQIYSNAQESKSATIRSKCTEFIVLMLQLWPKGELKGAELEKTLLSCLQDADPTARGEARKAMCKFSTFWPNRCRRILNTVDKGVVKTLQQEQPAVFAVMKRGPVNKLKQPKAAAAAVQQPKQAEQKQVAAVGRQRATIMTSPAFNTSSPAFTAPTNSSAYPTVGRKIGSLSGSCFDTPNQHGSAGLDDSLVTPEVNSINDSISKLLDTALFASHAQKNSPLVQVQSHHPPTHSPTHSLTHSLTHSPLVQVQPNHLVFASPASVAIRNARRKIAQTRSSIRIMSTSPCSPFQVHTPLLLSSSPPLTAHSPTHSPTHSLARSLAHPLSSTIIPGRDPVKQREETERRVC
jgi:hypothetical protein